MKKGPYHNTLYLMTYDDHVLPMYMVVSIWFIFNILTEFGCNNGVIECSIGDWPIKIEGS